MSSNVVRIRYLVLGMLATRPMSGYDIKRYWKGLRWLGGSPSFGSLYPALHALLQDGLVTVEVVPQKDRPPRKIYEITDEGRNQLQQWANEPPKPGSSLKSFLMRLMLAGSQPHAGVIAQLEQRRLEVANCRDLLQQNVNGEDEATSDLGRKLTLEYGLAVAGAELDWLDLALTRLGDESSGGHDV